MMKKLFLYLMMMIPLLVFAGTLSVIVDFPLPTQCADGALKDYHTMGYGTISGVGKYQLPVRNINILLPAGAELESYELNLSGSNTLSAPIPQINPPFKSSDGVLQATADKSATSRYSFLGIRKWGDLTYASFAVLPAIYDEAGQQWRWNHRVDISLDYSLPSKAFRNIIPPTFNRDDFFVNPEALRGFYRKAQSRNYDYLIISTAELYNAAQALVQFRSSQGLITSFANIADVLAQTPGANNAQKVRNYLIQEYDTHPFSYLLLIGDIDVLPVAMLTPEPDGSETVPSDFYYSDLSSNFDSDNDGRLGEYSTGMADQDWGVDFTPELFVGRISWSTTAAVAAIAARIVSFEQSTGDWKNKALLPAAYLNYAQEEWNMDFAETDGAGFMEFVKDTVLSDMQTTTLYEQLGYLPSYPSDYALDYDQLRTLLNTQSYGLLSWSAHGSATSSSRKVWMEDGNGNNIPDSYEMQWMNMVNRSSFDNLSNQDGMVVFCASCYNGRIDHSSTSLSEQVLLKKGVSVIGATRTGWYKIGWQNPGWGGLSSYNYHFLENYIRQGMTAGAAHGYTNLLHTQYYLFGDPIDSGGIIWPELQNVYTYLMYGDPAVGYVPNPILPQGEILVWEPNHHNGIPIVNAINDLGSFNVVYTDKLIPDYEYLHHFEAVFCLFGFGDTAYIIEPESLEYNLLNAYLNDGGRVYLEGWVDWNMTDPLFAKFGVSAVTDHMAEIASIRCMYNGEEMSWSYDAPVDITIPLVPTIATAHPLFESIGSTGNTDVIGVYNSNGSYRTIASTFQLFGATEPVYNLVDMVAVIFDTLNVGSSSPVSNPEEHLPVQKLSATIYPNPFNPSASISYNLPQGQFTTIRITNIRGQVVRTLDSGFKQTGKHLVVWNGKDDAGKSVATGVYLCQVIGARDRITQKMLLLK